MNQDDPDVLEIWNNVFIQFNREDDGSLRPLPAKHVDTGLGYERLVSVIQDKRSNYDTDVFSPIFAKIQELTGVREYRGTFGAEDADGIDTAYRVVADHVRTLTFALSDGGVPNNVGRGYVLRRILRRGSRYARKKLGVTIGSFFSSLMPVVVEQLVSPIVFISSYFEPQLSQGGVFPELTKKVDDLKEILDEEEESFSRTLDRGEKLFEQYAANARERGSTQLNGKDVWRLYDTYGFPVDLTRIMAEELGLTVNEEEFIEAQAQSKEASKASLKKGTKDVVRLDVHDIAALEKNADVPKTDDSPKFCSYGCCLDLDSLILICCIDQQPATLMLPSGPSTTTSHSSIRRLAYHLTLRLESSSIEPASTRRQVDRSMTPETSSSTASQTLK